MINITEHIQLMERKIENIIARHKKFGKLINAAVFLTGAVSIIFMLAWGLEITLDQKAMVTLVSLISISCGIGLTCIYNSMVTIKIKDYQSFINELREIEKKIGSTFDPREH